MHSVINVKINLEKLEKRKLYKRRLKQMRIKWKALLTKTVIWLLAEILLNIMGLDTLADYSEFVFDKNVMVYSN